MNGYVEKSKTKWFRISMKRRIRQIGDLWRSVWQQLKNKSFGCWTTSLSIPVLKYLPCLRKTKTEIIFFTYTTVLLAKQCLQARRGFMKPTERRLWFCPYSDKSSAYLRGLSPPLSSNNTRMYVHVSGPSPIKPLSTHTPPENAVVSSEKKWNGFKRAHLTHLFLYQLSPIP